MLNHPGLPQLLVILAYLSLLLGLAVFSSLRLKRTREDYQLASHTIGPVLLLLSLFGTTMTGFALVGSSGEAFREGIGVYGLLASSSGIIHSLCFFTIGLRVWGLAKRNGYATQIAFFRDRLDSDRIGLLLFPVLVGLSIPYVLVGIISAGGFVQQLTAGLWIDGPLGFATPGPNQGGVPRWLGAGTICGVVLIYVFFGGMRGTAWANALQTLVFMSLGMVTFVVIANRLGGQADLVSNLQRLAAELPESASTRVGMSRSAFFMYLLIPLSVGMFPHVFQHWLTARSAATFKLPIVAHPIFILIVWLPCVLLGVWATTPLLAEAVESVWMARGLDGPPPAIPGNPNYILPFMVKTLTPPLLGGFLAAGILAAIMSSLDSQFLCLGTIFNNDIVMHYRGEDRVSQSQQVVWTRGFVIGIVSICYAIYLLTEANAASVFALGIWCFSGFTALFPIVFAAVYWRKLSKAGAYSGLSAAVISWLVLFYFAWTGDQNLGSFVVNLPLGGDQVLALTPVVVMFASSLLTTVGVSLITPPPGPET
ncbi:MAG: sodium:solute symporter family protein, partial [Planctomycetaceae bacterium]